MPRSPASRPARARRRPAPRRGARPASAATTGAPVPGQHHLDPGLLDHLDVADRPDRRVGSRRSGVNRPSRRRRERAASRRRRSRPRRRRPAASTSASASLVRDERDELVERVDRLGTSGRVSRRPRARARRPTRRARRRRRWCAPRTARPRPTAAGARPGPWGWWRRPRARRAATAGGGSRPGRRPRPVASSTTTSTGSTASSTLRDRLRRGRRRPARRRPSRRPTGGRVPLLEQAEHVSQPHSHAANSNQAAASRRGPQRPAQVDRVRSRPGDKSPRNCAIRTRNAHNGLDLLFATGS